MARWVCIVFFVSALCAASVPGVAQNAGPMHFRDACRPGQKIVIAAVGDLLFHSSLQRYALSGNGRYADFWSPVASVLEGADLTYGNLEGPAAPGVAIGGRDVPDPGRRLDGRVYGPGGPVLSGLIFNYHPSVVADMKASGFDVVSTANNHAADRGPLGIDRTIDTFENVGLPFTGTRREGEPGRAWSVVTEAGGMRIAWLACTYSTNGMPHRNQVLECHGQKHIVMAEIRRLANDPAIHAVILTPHWGIEKSHQPLASDRAYAREAIAEGVTAIIGTHAHVLQPWEKVTLPDESDTPGREALVVYSTGNFISNQPWPPTRVGVIVLLELTRDIGEKASITAVGYIPTEVNRGAKGHRVSELRGKASSFLPSGNRVALDRFRDLPKNCAEPAVASKDAPPP